MPIALRIVEPFPDEPEPGMMWRYATGDVEGRVCWWIVLPNEKPVEPGLPSRISWRTTDLCAREPREMWSVTGEAPLLTVTPSIDVECWRTGGPDGEALSRWVALATSLRGSSHRRSVYSGAVIGPRTTWRWTFEVHTGIAFGQGTARWDTGSSVSLGTASGTTHPD